MTEDPTPIVQFRPFAHSPLDDSDVPALVALIRNEIDRHGPITFARFMEMALYEPGLGYYATSQDRTTRAGDFLTAPELHPIFGWTIAAQIEEMWERLDRPAEFVLREYGAGTGALGRQIHQRLKAIGSPLAKALLYEPIETAGRAHAGSSSGRMIGCVVANEFLDALPAHRVRRDSGVVQELLVDWRDGRFVEEIGELSDRRLASRDEGLPEGHVTEVSLAATDWLAEVHDEVEAGFVLVIDYGFAERDLHSPARAAGTVRAFRGQHVSSDALGGVGRQDITYHLNLDALERDGQAVGFELLGRTTAGRFLLASGLDDVYRDAREQADLDWDSAALLRAAIRRLLDTGGLGGYAVLMLGKDVAGTPPLRGLSPGATPLHRANV